MDAPFVLCIHTPTNYCIRNIIIETNIYRTVVI